MTDSEINRQHSEDTIIIDEDDGTSSIRRKNHLKRQMEDVNAVDHILEKERDKHNTYESKKSMSMEFRTTDVILNYFGIIYVIFQTHSEGSEYHWTEIAVLSALFFGMIVQFTIGFLMFLLLRTSREKVGRSCSATAINDMALFLSSISPLINGFLNILYSGGVAAGMISQQSTIANLTTVLVK